MKKSIPLALSALLLTTGASMAADVQVEAKTAAPLALSQKAEASVETPAPAKPEATASQAANVEVKTQLTDLLKDKPAAEAPDAKVQAESKTEVETK